MTDRVPIWFDSLHIGDVIVSEKGELSFAYEDRWRTTAGAFPLSVTMPISERVSKNEVISPWLANLLPEEEQLSILTRTLGLDRNDVLAILSEIGGDTAGALSFGEPSDRAQWRYIPLTEFYDESDPEVALQRHFDDLADRPFLVGEEGIRLSLAGGQKKTALGVLDKDGAPVLRLPGPGDCFALPLNGAPSTVIVKPENLILPGIVENETYCLNLAAAIGIEAAQASIVRAANQKAICVLRYDRRVGRNGTLQRVHQEDFAQANGVPPGRKYERGTLRGPDIATLLRTGAHLSSSDALSLLDQLIFNILVSNTDAHAKNYSLLFPISEAIGLAPLYDVSTVLLWPRVVQYFAQSIAGKWRKPENVAGRHWDAIAQDVGFRPSNVRSRVQQLVDLIVAYRVPITKRVSGYEAATKGYVEEVAQVIERNALRIAGRLADP